MSRLGDGAIVGAGPGRTRRETAVGQRTPVYRSGVAADRGATRSLIEYQTLFDDLLTASGAVVPRGIQVGFVELPK